MTGKGLLLADLGRYLAVSLAMSIISGYLFLLAGPAYASDITSFNTAENAIVFVANGMGLNARSLARVVKAGPYGRLEMDRMSFTGFLTTHAADGWVTDEAAAATALSTGFKTGRGMTGILRDGRTPRGFLARASASGFRTGIVTTARITHAGLSPFYTSLTNKYLEDQAARALVEGDIDVIFGGGRMSFLPVNDGGLQGDNRNWIENARSRGYRLVENRSELMAISEFHSRILGLFAEGAMAMDIDRPVATQPSLAEMTTKAIQTLSRRDDRFVLVVETGRLSRAAHDHDAQSVAREVSALDDAVASALDFAQRSGNTLVLVVSPYEAGGPVITDRLDTISLESGRTSARTLASRISSSGDNINDVFRLYANIQRLSEEELITLGRYAGRQELPRVTGHIISRRQGVFFPGMNEPSESWIGNTGAETPVLAEGPGAHLFSGTNDNSHIAPLILKALDLKQ